MANTQLGVCRLAHLQWSRSGFAYFTSEASVLSPLQIPKQCSGSARSAVRPSQAKRESARHYNRSRISPGFVASQTRIDCEPFTAHQSSRNTGLNNALKHPPEHIAVAESL